MELAAMLLLLAVFTERLTDWVKSVTAVNGNYSKIVALIIALIFAFGANIDFFTVAGIQFAWPVVGKVLTGIVISGGANYAQDLLDLITSWRRK